LNLKCVDFIKMLSRSLKLNGVGSELRTSKMKEHIHGNQRR
jgi:hypothetical protein